jgi:RNA polymerase-binding protein
VASGSAIRGTRVGAGPIRWAERGEQAARRTVSYWCANGHATHPSFAADVTAPALWECPSCGLPAGQEQHNPPAPPRAEPYKTHLAYVKERRTDDDAAAILAEALSQLRQRRGTG